MWYRVSFCSVCRWSYSPHKCGSVKGRWRLCLICKYNPVHYQITDFVNELFLLYCPHFLFNFFFLFSNFILYFQLRLSPVPQTLPVPVPCYYHGSNNDSGHVNNSFRPLSLPVPSHTEADPAVDTEIIAGSLQVSSWCYTDAYWQTVLGQSVPKYFQKIYWGFSNHEFVELLFMKLLGKSYFFCQYIASKLYLNKA